MRIRCLLTCLMGGMFFFLPMGGDFLLSSPQPLVRVAVLKNSEHFKISSRGHYQILNPTGRILYEGRTLRDANVTADPTGIWVGPQKFYYDRVTIQPQREITLQVKGKERRFRGKLEVHKEGDTRLLVINELELEDYIKGVLYHEADHRWPQEALKVQAVAARTYVLYRIKEDPKGLYHVTNDIYSQVYGGKTSERYRTNIAVNTTKGEVVVYKNVILPAYYHASCGGATEDASELWKTDLPPLKGVRCPYCVDLPHYHWEKNFRLKDIQGKLNGQGYQLGLIQEIAVLARNPSGRIKSLQITARDGKSVIIAGKDFRDIVGPNDIKSNNYEVVMKGYYMDLIGHGWGHGVGLCQWGASAMARLQYSYQDILQYYYPGIEIVSIETLFKVNSTP